MTNPEHPSYHGVIYKNRESEVLLLQTTPGHYTLPESDADPVDEEVAFLDDMRRQTGLELAPLIDDFANSSFTIEHKANVSLRLPAARASSFILSRIVGGELSLSSQFSAAEWTSITRLPDPAALDPRVSRGLEQFQIAWALANTR